MIRGGHIDTAVLGGMQVSAAGDLANWMVPGQDGQGHGRGDGPGPRRPPRHRADGAHRQVRCPEDRAQRCTLPLTGAGVVHRIITNLAVIDVTDRVSSCANARPACPRSPCARRPTPRSRTHDQSGAGATAARGQSPGADATAKLGAGSRRLRRRDGGRLVIARFLPTVSPLLVAILFGAVTANLVSLPSRMKPGLRFAAKRLLRIGIALLGLQLMFSDIASLGIGMIVVVVAIVVLGIGGMMFVGRLLGL